MKAVSIISLIMLVMGIGFAIVGEWGILAAVFLIPTSFLFLVIGKITFLLSAKFTSNKKKDLTFTTTDKPRNKMKSIQTVCFSMLIISIVFSVMGTWGVIEHKFERFAIAAVMISYLLFPLSLLLLLVLIVQKITSLISAKIEPHKKDDLAAELTTNQTSELTTELMTTQPTAELKSEQATNPTNKPTAKSKPNMQTVKVISFTLFIISLIFGAFFYWGTYTQAKYDRFNDIAGIIPVSALFLSILFFIIALLLLPLAKFFTRMIALSKSSHYKIKDK